MTGTILGRMGGVIDGGDSGVSAPERASGLEWSAPRCSRDGSGARSGATMMWLSLAQWLLCSRREQEQEADFICLVEISSASWMTRIVIADVTVFLACRCARVPYFALQYVCLLIGRSSADYFFSSRA